MNLILKIEVPEQPCPTDLEDLGDRFCSASYPFRIHIGEHILDGRGWLFCGWLPPGACCDLDGSGLHLWGSSQPGDWRCLDSDGQNSGKPQVMNPDLQAPGLNPGLPILVGPTAGGQDAQVTPEVFPEWQTCLSAGDDVGAEKARERMVSYLNELLTCDFAPRIGPPSAELVWTDLKAPTEKLPDIRVGNWRGAGPCLAWKADGGYKYLYYPDEYDVVEICQKYFPDATAGDMRVVQDAVV